MPSASAMLGPLQAIPEELLVCFLGFFFSTLLVLFAFRKPPQKQDPERAQKAQSRKVMASAALQARSARAGREL